MAPKRPLPSEYPPPAPEEESSGASDDEETEEEKEEGRESGESESKSESDEEDDKVRQEIPSQPKPSSPPPPPKQKSEGGSSWTESESGSESESEAHRYTVKPIASKPMEKIATPPAKKRRQEPSSISKQPSAKRKVELEGSKRGKKKDVAENGSLQKSAEESKKPTLLERPKENGELIPSEQSDTVSMLYCDEMLQMSGIGLDQDFLKKGWEMVDESRKEELKGRWRKLQLTEMRVLAERATLIRDQTNLVLEAFERATGK